MGFISASRSGSAGDGSHEPRSPPVVTEPPYQELDGNYACAWLPEEDPALEIILRFQPTRDVVAEFGAPMRRWRRTNQLQLPVWPSLLEPAARPLDGQRPSEQTMEACPTQ